MCMLEDNKSMKKKVFISFDYDNDVTQKNLLIGQAKNPDSPFEISDFSIKKEMENWQDEAERKIRNADIVIVLCGKNVNNATGVNIELKITQKLSKKYYLLNAYNNLIAIKPSSAKPDDIIHDWTWENLKRLLS